MHQRDELNPTLLCREHFKFEDWKDLKRYYCGDTDASCDARLEDMTHCNAWADWYVLDLYDGTLGPESYCDKHFDLTSHSESMYIIDHYNYGDHDE